MRLCNWIRRKQGKGSVVQRERGRGGRELHLRQSEIHPVFEDRRVGQRGRWGVAHLLRATASTHALSLCSFVPRPLIFLFWPLPDSFISHILFPSSNPLFSAHMANYTCPFPRLHIPTIMHQTSLAILSLAPRLCDLPFKSPLPFMLEELCPYDKINLHFHLAGRQSDHIRPLLHAFDKANRSSLFLLVDGTHRNTRKDAHKHTLCSSFPLATRSSLVLQLTNALY